MNCYNCGAEINGKELMCPYCGAENEEVARVMQDEALAQYEELTEKLETDIPDMQVSTSSRVIVCTVVVLGILAVVGVTLAYFIL